MRGTQHDPPDEMSGAPPGFVLLVSRLVCGSVGLALLAIMLLSGFGQSWPFRALGGTLGMLSAVGVLLGALATVRPSVLRGLRLGRGAEMR